MLGGKSLLLYSGGFVLVDFDVLANALAAKYGISASVARGKLMTISKNPLKLLGELNLSISPGATMSAKRMGGSGEFCTLQPLKMKTDTYYLVNPRYADILLNEIEKPETK